MSQNEMIIIRPAIEEDISFVVDSWIKHLWSTAAYHGIDKRLQHNRHLRFIMDVFKRENVQLHVAHYKEDVNQICGYIIGEVSKDIAILHWVHVKKFFREHGVAHALEQKILESKPKHVYYSHWTPNIKESVKKRKYSYNPYAFWRTDEIETLASENSQN